MWIGVSICAIALICSVVSLGLPYWAVYEYEALGVTINYGLFQVCSDDRQSDCELTAQSSTMNAVRSLECIGTLLLLVSVILAVIKLCSSTNRPTLFKASGVLAIIAAIVIIIGVIVFGAKKELQTLETKNIDYKFHAGFYIAIVAGVLAIIAGVLFLIDPVIERHRREEQVLQSRDPMVEWRNRTSAADHVDSTNSRIITTHSYYSHPRSYNDQPGGYYIGSQPYYYKKHHRHRDFAL